jgi:hypothetical protein
VAQHTLGSVHNARVLTQCRSSLLCRLYGRPRASHCVTRTLRVRTATRSTLAPCSAAWAQLQATPGGGFNRCRVQRLLSCRARRRAERYALDAAAVLRLPAQATRVSPQPARPPQQPWRWSALASRWSCRKTRRAAVQEDTAVDRAAADTAASAPGAAPLRPRHSRVETAPSQPASRSRSIARSVSCRDADDRYTRV